MNLVHFFLLYGSLLAIILRCISSAELLFFCIPLQLKELRVFNGLRRLRIQLLAFGIILFIVNVLTILLLLNIYLHEHIQGIMNIYLQLFNALAFNALAFIGHSMYTAQYSEENLEHHEKVERLEKDEQTRIDTETVPT